MQAYNMLTYCKLVRYIHIVNRSCNLNMEYIYLALLVQLLFIKIVKKESKYSEYKWGKVVSKTKSIKLKMVSHNGPIKLVFNQHKNRDNITKSCLIIDH